MNRLIVLLCLLVTNAALAQEVATTQEPSLALTQPETRELAYPLMKLEALEKKRQAVIAEYIQKLNSDPRFKAILEEIRPIAADLEKLQNEILSRHKVTPQTHAINWEEERIEPVPTAAAAASPPEAPK